MSKTHTPVLTGPPPRDLADYLVRPGSLSQRALAAHVGVNQSFISMVARGLRACRGAVAQRIHRLTGVPVAVLVQITKPLKKHAVRLSRGGGGGARSTRRRSATRGDSDDDADVLFRTAHALAH